MTRILGIDPGLSGAFALLDTKLKTLNTFDVPIFSEKKNGKLRRSVNISALYASLAGEFIRPDLAVIEAVHAMPAQGVSSSFRFGEVYGVVQAAVLSFETPLFYVQPSAWKRHFKLGRDKETSRKLASQMYPKYADQWVRVKDSDRAEAALIATWYSQVHGDAKFATRG
jgi:Holliday junction resolvasome RuvABC endonuclease subunit